MGCGGIAQSVKAHVVPEFHPQSSFLKQEKKSLDVVAHTDKSYAPINPQAGEVEKGLWDLPASQSSPQVVKSYPVRSLNENMDRESLRNET